MPGVPAGGVSAEWQYPQAWLSSPAAYSTAFLTLNLVQVALAQLAHLLDAGQLLIKLWAGAIAQGARQAQLLPQLVGLTLKTKIISSCSILARQQGFFSTCPAVQNVISLQTAAVGWLYALCYVLTPASPS